MNDVAQRSWQDSNYQYLLTALGRPRLLLTRWLASLDDDEEFDATAVDVTGIDRQLADISEAMPFAPALEALVERFGLDNFERDVLLTCAGAELDRQIADLCGAAGSPEAARYPTLEMLLQSLPDAHWNALCPASPLRSWRLIDLSSGLPATRGPVQIDERILNFLLGVNYLDQRLEGIVAPIVDGIDLPPRQQELAARVMALWSEPLAQTAEPIELSGKDGGAKASIAILIAKMLGTPAYEIRLNELPGTAQECAAAARLCDREALLTSAIFYIDAGTPRDRSLNHLADELRSPFLVATTEPLMLRRPMYRLDVARPDTREQAILWRSLLPDDLSDAAQLADKMAATFDLDTRGIRGVATTFRGLRAGSECDEETSLRQICRAQTRSRLDELADRVEPLAGWDDLVLRDSQSEVLRQIVAHMRYRNQVYEHWGFAGKSNRGLGVTALFAGPSGTGKTMAAEVLGGELNLDLYRIDLSQVVSKYIGETEKNLKLVFDAAEESGAILLFDEADALFGKRSEVRDSHDRYANIEVSYLLQRMESYRGLAILTSNMKDALDDAFLRRLRFVINFPFPGFAQRKGIWQGVFPEQAPTDNLDSDKLAQLDVAGGNIRNIALNAAFLAAADGGTITGSEILRAARGEYSKRDRIVTDAETKGWP